MRLTQVCWPPTCQGSVGSVLVLGTNNTLCLCNAACIRGASPPLSLGCGPHSMSTPPPSGPNQKLMLKTEALISQLLRRSSYSQGPPCFFISDDAVGFGPWLMSLDDRRRGQHYHCFSLSPIRPFNRCVILPGSSPLDTELTTIPGSALLLNRLSPPSV